MFGVDQGEQMQGRVLGGRYELVAPLGAGGMGSVWRAQDAVLGRPVAVKTLLPGLLSDPRFLDRFAREARVAASLVHPNIVMVHDTGIDVDTPYIVMELVEGRTLADWLAFHGRLEMQTIAHFFDQILAAIDHAHRKGVVHRDLKPANLMISSDRFVKVADFGLATMVGEAALTLTGAALGTPSYLSPEQAYGGGASFASDQYAIACVLYECLTGRPPFSADHHAVLLEQHRVAAPVDLGELRPDAPSLLREVVHRALDKDPDGRYPSVGQFRDLVLHSLRGDDRSGDTTVADSEPLIVKLRAEHQTPPAPGSSTDATVAVRDPAPARVPKSGRAMRIVLAVVAVVALLAGGYVVVDSRVPAAAPKVIPAASWDRVAKVVYSADGNLWVYDLAGNAVVQVTSNSDADMLPEFAGASTVNFVRRTSRRFEVHKREISQDAPSIPLFPSDHPILDVTFANSGKGAWWLAHPPTTQKTATVTLWRGAQRIRDLGSWDVAALGGRTKLAWSADQSLLLIVLPASEGGKVFVVRQDGSDLAVLTAREAFWTPDSRKLVIKDRAWFVLDLTNNDRTRLAVPAGAERLAVSPDGARAAFQAGGAVPEVRVVELRSGKVLVKLPSHAAPIWIDRHRIIATKVRSCLQSDQCSAASSQWLPAGASTRFDLRTKSEQEVPITSTLDADVLYEPR